MACTASSFAVAAAPRQYAARAAAVSAAAASRGKCFRAYRAASRNAASRFV